ncbi:MAG: thermonuclease family protein [Alphaproteobacteria bacterium]
MIDGDTLAVRARIWLDQDVATIVRIDGIDAPELRGTCDAERARAVAARAALAWLIGDGPVTLTDVGHDKYGGRVRAEVATAAGADVAETLIAAGLVRRYAGGTRQPWCTAGGDPMP